MDILDSISEEHVSDLAVLLSRLLENVQASQNEVSEKLLSFCPQQKCLPWYILISVREKNLTKLLKKGTFPGLITNVNENVRSQGTYHDNIKEIFKYYKSK